MCSCLNRQLRCIIRGELFPRNHQTNCAWLEPRCCPEWGRNWSVGHFDTSFAINIVTGVNGTKLIVSEYCRFTLALKTVCRLQFQEITKLCCFRLLTQYPSFTLFYNCSRLVPVLIVKVLFVRWNCLKRWRFADSLCSQFFHINYSYITVIHLSKCFLIISSGLLKVCDRIFFYHWLPFCNVVWPGTQQFPGEWRPSGQYKPSGVFAALWRYVYTVFIVRTASEIHEM